MIRYIFICLLLCMTCPTAKAAKTKTNIPGKKIERLEQKLNHYKLTDDLNKQIQERISQARKDQLEIIEKRYEQKHEELMLEVKRGNFYLKTIGWLLGALISGCVGLLFYIPNYARKKAAEEVDRQIAKTIEAKNKVMRRMISDSETETILRNESKLMALSKDAAGKNKMLDLLGSMGFHDYDSKLLGDIWNGEAFKENFDYSKYLIMFNHIDEEDINKILGNTRKTSMVSYYMGTQGIEKRERINFANSPFTLYARTMEVLKYNYLAEKNS